MARQVALLRAVNVGGRNRIAMSDLRELLEGLGYENVATLLQSGNAVFDSGDAPGTTARKIKDALSADLRLNVEVLVRTAADMAKIVARNPLDGKATNAKWYMVVFLGGKADAGLIREVDPAQYHPELFEAHGSEIYAWFPSGVQGAKLTHAFWEKRLRVTATARNWNTVEKLHELASS